MDDDERERRRNVIDEAWRAVDRVSAEQREPHDTRPRDPLAEALAADDANRAAFNAGDYTPQPQPEPPPRRRKLDTAPIDWAAHVRAVIEREREFQREVLAEIVAEIRSAYNDDLERALRTLNAELADLKAALAEHRLAVAIAKAEKAGVVLDLPRLPLRSGLN